MPFSFWDRVPGRGLGLAWGLPKVKATLALESMRQVLQALAHTQVVGLP
jgi:hypothetical protein